MGDNNWDYSNKSYGELSNSAFNGNYGAERELQRRADLFKSPSNSGGNATSGLSWLSAVESGTFSDTMSVLAGVIFLGIMYLIGKGFYRDFQAGEWSQFKTLICLGLGLLTVGIAIGFVKVLLHYIKEHTILFVLLMVGGTWIYRQLPPLPHLGGATNAAPITKTTAKHRKS